VPKDGLDMNCWPENWWGSVVENREKIGNNLGLNFTENPRKRKLLSGIQRSQTLTPEGHEDFVGVECGYPR